MSQIERRDKARYDYVSASAGALLVPFFWLCLSLPVSVPSAAYLLAGALLPLLRRDLASWLYLTSFFFLSTFGLASSELMFLRVYWLAFGLTQVMLVERFLPPRSLIIIALLAAITLAWGAMLAGISPSVSDGGFRSAGLELAGALLWVAGAIVGAGLMAQRDGSLKAFDLAIISFSWLVSFSYGARQFIFGINELTVPAEIFAYIGDYAQYEDLGRRPFAFRTANAMAVITLVPFAVLLLNCGRRLSCIFTVLLFAIATGALTLTRSYLLVIFASVFLVALVTGGRVVRPALSFAGLLVFLGLAAFYLIPDVELLFQFARVTPGGGGTRLDIWLYTLQNVDMQTVILGKGLGLEGVASFFSGFPDLKQISSPHNIVLEMLLQFGVLGLVFLVVLAANVAKWLFSTRFHSANLGFALAATLILTRELVAASYVLSAGMLAGLFWFCIGCASQIDACGKPESEAEDAT